MKISLGRELRGHVLVTCPLIRWTDNLADNFEKPQRSQRTQRDCGAEIHYQFEITMIGVTISNTLKTIPPKLAKASTLPFFLVVNKPHVIPERP